MLKQRIITALVLLPLVLGAIFGLSNHWFALAMAVPVLIGAYEWANLMGIEELEKRAPYVAFIVILAGIKVAMYYCGTVVGVSGVFC